MLYVPGNSVKMITRAATLSSDAVILDLEDAVPFLEKETARIITRDSIRVLSKRGISTFVRVNSLATGLTKEDVETVVVEGLDGIVLAKTESVDDVAQIDKMLTVIERNSGLQQRSVKVVTLIESAKGLINSYQIASSSDRLMALAFGAGDYSRDLGRDVIQISSDQTELLYARSHLVNTSRAAGIQAIDTPFLGLLTDKESFSKEVRLAMQLGFKGKQCVHPSQIELINNVFSPAKEDVERAKRVVKAFEEAQGRGLGATSLDGRMMDYMSYQQAKEALKTAQVIEEKGRTKSAEANVGIREIFDH
jgi:citrate lyase subunit beta/citryl-CoA lyase